MTAKLLQKISSFFPFLKKSAPIRIPKKNEVSHQDFMIDYYQNTLPVTTRYFNAIEKYRKEKK